MSNLFNSAPAPRPAPAPASAGKDWIKDTSTDAFRADVIEASLQTPVLVDFWAPWCGPCKQLTPALEKVVTAANGKIKLVKINVDENQALAGQMGVQSIPAVFAFSGGRPIDGFMGALPEGEIKKFIDKVIAAAPPAPPQPQSMEEQIALALEAGTAALDASDLGEAAQIFGMVLQHEPENAPALIGLAKVYYAANQIEQAQLTLDIVPEADRKGEAYTALATSLRLATEAAGLSQASVLEQRLELDPNDHQARFDLAIVRNAEGDRLAAAEALVALMKRDRTWNDDGARKKLIELFEAWGAKEPATLKGRRMLSALLFS